MEGEDPELPRPGASRIDLDRRRRGTGRSPHCGVGFRVLMDIVVILGGCQGYIYILAVQRIFQFGSSKDQQ